MPARRPALLAVSLIAILLLPSSSAAASYSTRVVVSLKFPAFHGQVESTRKACTKSRKVKLLSERPGPDRQLGADTTNARGKWSIPIGKLASGTYYAKAPAKGKCRAAKSSLVPID